MWGWRLVEKGVCLCLYEAVLQHNRENLPTEVQQDGFNAKKSPKLSNNAIIGRIMGK